MARTFKKVVVHENIKKNHTKAITALGGKVESTGPKPEHHVVIRFSAKDKMIPAIEKFYDDRKIELIEYTPKERV